jgi:adenosylcobinamide-GDP ribazoletransferase
MNGLAVAIAYLTILRLPGKRNFDLRGAVVWFPMVGLLLGAILAVSWTGFVLVAPRPVATFLTLLLWVWLTGGMHLDGLADTSDALLSWRNRDNMLAVMRSPQVGPVGMAALMSVLLAKAVALHNLSDAKAAAVLLCAPLLGRCAQTLSTCFMGYAKDEGVAVTAFGVTRKWPRILASLIPLVVCFQLGWESAALVIGGVFLLGILLLRRIRNLLGGMTGDTLGAVTEIVEAAVLILATIAIPQWPWF